MATVYALAVQPDGKVLVGGSFRDLIIRFNPDETPDGTFNSELSGSSVRCLVVQADGKILVGGSFTRLGGQVRHNLGRFHADTTVDSSFNPGANSQVDCLAVQPDGRILVSGLFTNLAGQARSRIARLNVDGTLDSTFDPGADARVYALAVQADGKILVGGQFTNVGGQPRERIARLNADGTLDVGFNPGASGGGAVPYVSVLAVQADGKILVGGQFTSLGGQSRDRLARPATQSLNHHGTQIRWLRGGSSPEVWRTIVEHSADGLEWTFLGAGTRTVEGWELTPVSAPPGGTLRARGFAAGGYFNGSGSFVEGYFGRPILLSPPESRTNGAGSTAIFRVMAGPDETLGFQWLKNGLPLVNQADTSGANGAILSLSNVLGAAGGSYSVVVSNGFGSVTSAPAILTVNDPYFTDLTRGEQQEAGGTARLLRNVQGTAPVRYHWYHDGVAVPGASGLAFPSPNSSATISLTMSNLTLADAGVYTVVASNAYASVTSSPTLLIVNAATVDNTFDAGVDSGAISSGFFNQMLVQPDGKILVGGSFRSLGGQLRDSIARLNADGTLDGAFDPGVRSVTLGVTFNGSVNSLALQTDGKILVGGYFNRLAGQVRTNIGRLNADGTLDTGFSPGGVSGNSSYGVVGVHSLVLQTDGKILVGGLFTNLAGQARNYIGRLNADGTLDNTFDPGANLWVSSLAVQADGKILVSGSFTNIAGQPRNRIARLNTDGTLDPTFNPDANDFVGSMAVQADGKILIRGNFTMLGGQPRSGFARINADGTLDSTFDPAAVHSLFVGCLAIQADGKIIVGGRNTLARQVPSSLSRLNPDGTLDHNFNPDVLAANTLAILADGKILVGGAVWINNVEDQLRPNVSRLNNTDPATQILSYDGATITWSRSGTGPEVWRTTFEHSTDGLAWTSLGAGTRIPGGWELTGVSVPPGGTLRARGHVTGDHDGSGWFVEDSIGPPTLLSQPVGRSSPIGASADFHAGAGGTPPLSYQWYHDGVLVPGAVGPSLTLQNLSRSDGGRYTVVVSNALGSVTSAPALLTVYAPATPDSTFNPGISGGIVTEYFPNPFVNALAVQADEKILVGGNFAILGGQPRNFIGRLNPDGTVDGTFNPGADHWVDTMAVQADGGVLVGGFFSTLGGQERQRIGRIRADGTLDSAFNPGVAGNLFQNVFFTWVRAFALQPDGKIVVGGSFAGLGGLTRKHARLHIGRLHPNGTLDSTFNPGANAQVFALAMQTNGMILMGGDFTTVRRKPRNYIARVNSKGALDSKFNPGASERVLSLAVQPDGKILVGGNFTNLAGQTCRFIGRLHPDGTLDTGFQPQANGSVLSLALQADGKVLVGGYFTTLGGQARNRLARLHPDGSLDNSFNPGVNDGVNCVAVQADGGVVIGGEFTTLGGQSRPRIGRLGNTDPPVEAFGHAGSNLTWTRGGAGPEFWRTTFEHTTNGVTWTLLGGGTRIPGGWQRTGAAFPPGSTARARGYVAGGDEGSAWFIEEYFGKPVILSHPASRTNGATATATFRVSAEGSDPLTYQWLKNGVALADQGTVAGSASAMLVLSNLLRADEGAYQVVVGNGFGSVTSAVAYLVVPNPHLTQQPSDEQRHAGESVTFNVTAVGTPPPSYQWYRDGAVLSGATNPSLTLPGLSGADSGYYAVVASNAAGTVTSRAALLEVNTAVVDSGFSPNARDGYLTAVRALSFLQDGKILVGGDFTTLDGWSIQNLGRLNTNGTLDFMLVPQADWFVFSLAAQTDGKTVVGGGFGDLGGQWRDAIGRLNSDGTLDAAFNPSTLGGDGIPFGDGWDGTTVYSVALQPDGKILLGGNFKTVAGQKRSRLARLNADGSLDTTFVPGATGGYNMSIRSIVVLPEGKILVGGDFTSLGGKSRKYLGRINPDGKLDATFVPTVDGAVHCLALMAEGKILIGGEFAIVNGQPRRGLARLNADGTLDTSFTPEANGNVYALYVQGDGRILIGGSFTAVGGRARRGLARLHPDGLAEITFNPDVSGVVYSIAVHAVHGIVVGGSFDSVAGQTRANIARLVQTVPVGPLLGSGGSPSGVALVEGVPDGQSSRSFPEHWTKPEGSNTLASPIRLRMVRDGSTAVLTWSGGQRPYQVQQTTDLSDPASWLNVGGPVETNSIVVPIGDGNVFLRVRGP